MVNLNNDEKLNLIFYSPSIWKEKIYFTDEDYELYIDFGYDIGQLTLDNLSNVCTDDEIDAFKLKMNYVDSNDEFERKLNYSFISKDDFIYETIKKVKKELKFKKNLYVEKFNSISNEEILNYLYIGIVKMYNKDFLKLLLGIIDEDAAVLVLNEIKKTDGIYIDKECNISENKLYSLINFPKENNEETVDYFNMLKPLRFTSYKNNNGVIKLSKSEDEVQYESYLEKEMLIKFDSCEFIKFIKTQSIEIEYSYKEKNYKYYPDFQLLTYDNQLIIVEIKNMYDICDSLNIAKYNALKEFCDSNGFGYLMVDDKGNSLEKISKIKINEIKTKSFIKLLKYKGKLNYRDFKSFKKLYKLTMKEMAKILLDNDEIEMRTRPYFYIKYNEQG